MEILNLVASVPSLIAALVMFYLCLKKYILQYIHKLIFALAIADIIYSSSNIMTVFRYPADGILCKLEASARYFSSGLILWLATSISVLHYKIITQLQTFRKTRFIVVSLTLGVLLNVCLALEYAYILLYHLTYYTFRPVLVSQIFAYQRFGTTCYVSFGENENGEADLINFVLYYGLFIFGGCLTTLLSYLLTMKKIRTEADNNEDLKTNRLLLYPVVLFITSLPPVINKLLNMMDYNLMLPTTAIMLITHSIGFWNAVFMISQKVSFVSTRDISWSLQKTSLLERKVVCLTLLTYELWRKTGILRVVSVQKDMNKLILQMFTHYSYNT